MKISFNNTRFKNFLSYGSAWQSFDFLNGLNMIVGDNGSGKCVNPDTIIEIECDKKIKNIITKYK